MLGTLFGSVALAADAPAADPRIGMRVVTKAPKMKLKVGENDVVTGDEQVVYKVTRLNGPWFWVVAGDVGGWVPQDDVVPFDQAIDYFTDQIRSHPQNAWLFQMRGLIWYDRKDYDRAISDYIEAAALDPKDATSYHNLGNAWLAKREYDNAINDYNEATNLDPKDTASYYHRALAWVAKRELSLAIADYNEAIRLDPKDPLKHRNRGLAWAAAHEYGPALADFAEVVKLDPTDALAFNGQGWIMATCPDAKFRDGKKAVESATRACELRGWKEPYFLGTLAASYAEAGDFDAAVKWQTQALSLFPKDDQDRNGHRRRLTLYQAKKTYQDSSP